MIILCAGSFSANGPPLHPSRQQRAVFFHEVKGDGERRREIDSKESPGLPVIKRPCCCKQQRGHDQEQDRQSTERFQM